MPLLHVVELMFAPLAEAMRPRKFGGEDGQARGDHEKGWAGKNQQCNPHKEHKAPHDPDQNLLCVCFQDATISPKKRSTPIM